MDNEHTIWFLLEHAAGESVGYPILRDAANHLLELWYQAVFVAKGLEDRAPDDELVRLRGGSAAVVVGLDIVSTHRTAEIPYVYRLGQVALEDQLWWVERQWRVVYSGWVGDVEC